MYTVRGPMLPKPSTDQGQIPQIPWAQWQGTSLEEEEGAIARDRQKEQDRECVQFANQSFSLYYLGGQTEQCQWTPKRFFLNFRALTASSHSYQGVYENYCRNFAKVEILYENGFNFEIFFIKIRLCLKEWRHGMKDNYLLIAKKSFKNLLEKYVYYL